MEHKFEIRATDVWADVEALEVRADADTKATWVGGYAARFNTRSRDLGGFTEVIQPGAFLESLNSGNDIRALVSHDPHKLLSRTANKTLRVWEDAKGLRFESLVPDMTYGRDMLALMQLGTVGQMSFGFRVTEGGDAFAQEGETTIRTITKANLFEVSVVATPAYPSTNVSIRIDPDIATRMRDLQGEQQVAQNLEKWMQYRLQLIGA